MKAIFASRNRHKAEQVARLLVGVELLALDEVAPDVELNEPFDTFEDNALAKARAVVEATGRPAVADDSGLEVDALEGAPGVTSARYAGPDASDEDNNAKLIDALREVPEHQLTARYRCVATLVLPDGEVFVAHGSCEGRISMEAKGELGFGYDPHFIPIPSPDVTETRTMGEIRLDEKLAFNHRGRAFRELASQLRRDNFTLDPDESSAAP